MLSFGTECGLRGFVRPVRRAVWMAMDIHELSGGRVHDQFDVSLEDSDLLGEVELTTNLIIAASESEEHLSQPEIDDILGIALRRDAS